MSGTASPPQGPLSTDAAGWTAPLTPEQRREHEAIGQALAAEDRTRPSMEEWRARRMIALLKPSHGLPTVESIEAAMKEQPK